jgi:hypothetical protein
VVLAVRGRDTLVAGTAARDVGTTRRSRPATPSRLASIAEQFTAAAELRPRAGRPVALVRRARVP